MGDILYVAAVHLDYCLLLENLNTSAKFHGHVLNPCTVLPEVIYDGVDGVDNMTTILF